METIVKPRVLISKCLEHEACRYDGSMISSDFVKRIRGYVEFITVCPEVAIGLPIPREAIRLVERDKEKRLVASMSGQDCTEDMKVFVDQFAKSELEKPVHGAILKSRSPTCGIKNVKIYESHGRIACLPKKSTGFFSDGILRYAPLLPLEDEGRLLNYDIRDHFLTRIFTLARFDEVKHTVTMAALVEFQSRCKYLLMAYHQTEQKLLGRIVANHDQLPLDRVFASYEDHLKKALVKPLRKGKNTNMILHMFGYVSDYLSADEKAFFLEELSLYNQNKKPLSAVMTVLYGWVIRFDVTYLKMQYIFKPYPIEILDVLDSGKGIL
jgi:uncharacterized protein YbgA (DUF1722 family)/uncharacterized protein YbbK (DUF523 family)